MKLFRLLLPVFLITVFSISLFGEDIEYETSIGTQCAYYFDNNEGYGDPGGFIAPDYSPVDTPTGYLYGGDDYGNTEPRSLGSGWGAVELQFFLKHKITIPVNAGDGFLVADDNIGFNFDLYAAPVAAYVKSSATITPIAFLQFEMGVMIGTGWNAKIFNGVGNNVNGYLEEDSFPGVVAELFSSVTLQFDLAALLPGKWNHVVAMINAEFLYSYFSTDEARAGKPWQWLADSGENLNGFSFEGSYFLGYQMPLILDAVGVLVETSQLIDSNSRHSPMAGSDGKISTSEDNGWGSDFIQVTFGPLAYFSIDDHNSLVILVQFQTGKDYTDKTIFNQYYQNRVYEDTYIKLHRVALAYSYKF